MRVRMFCLQALAFVGFCAPAPSQVPLPRGGPIRQTESCIPVEQRKSIEALAAANERSLRPTNGLAAGGSNQLAFYPMGGRLWRDLGTINFVDLDSGPGLLDWDCTDYTYNGHDASDTDLRSFGEQDIGVPVFAALDGVVIAVQEGLDDHNTCPNEPCTLTANYVILSHSQGRRTYYWHLRKNSVAVSLGQPVVAGQQLGLVGSSGNSSWSHLHFEVYDNDGATLVEPYSGPCNPAASQWTEQTPIRRDTYLRDFGFTDESFESYPGHPYEFPRTGQFGQSDLLSFWMLMQNLPSGSTLRVRFERPDGVIAEDSGDFQFGLSEFYRFSWWWWGPWEVPGRAAHPGTWHMWLDVNGVREVTAPFEQRVAQTSDFNRPPEPISVDLQPNAPMADDVIFCAVNTDLLLDDLDYQIVRYRYVWTLDGDVVRDNTFAGQADAIPRGLASPGQFLECSVTPSDGMADGPTAAASAYVGPLAPCEPGSPPCPTLSQWGLTSLALILGIGGTILVARQAYL